MVGSLILTCININTNPSRCLKSPSTIGFPGRRTNSWWACFKPILWLPKTVSSWRISWRANKWKHKCSKKRRKKSRNLTLKLNMIQESWTWWSPPKNLEKKSSIVYCRVAGTPRPLSLTWWKIRSNFNSYRLPKFRSIMSRDGKRKKDSWNSNKIQFALNF